MWLADEESDVLIGVLHTARAVVVGCCAVAGWDAQDWGVATVARSMCEKTRGRERKKVTFLAVAGWGRSGWALAVGSGRNGVRMAEIGFGYR